MKQGYIRLWRKSLDSGLIRNHKVWIFWTWCLLKANHEHNHKQVVGFNEVILQPGDFVFGRAAAAEETGLSEQNIRTCLKFLEKSKNLTIKSTNKFSIISIINWNSYQYIEDETNQQTNQHLTSIQPASNHKQEHLNKEVTTPLPPKGKDVELKDFLLKNIPDDLSFLKNNILEFFKYRQQKPKSKRYQSEIGINGLFRDICNCIAVGHPPVECLNIAMERGWQTPSPDYFKPEMFTKLTNGTVQETKEQILKRHGLSA